MHPTTLLAVLVVLSAPLRADQIGLTYGGKPYNLVKANWMAANYLQALTSPRWEATAFAQDRFGDEEGRGGLYFIDDQGRVIACFAMEAEYGPVVRVETVATLVRGNLRARIPGSEGRYFFVIDGRQAQYLRPHGDHIGAYWLQDTSTPFCTLEASFGERGEPFHVPEVERLPEVMEAETVYDGTLGPAGVKLASHSSVRDLAPVLEITAPQPGPLTLRVKPVDPCHFLHAGKPGRLSPKQAAEATGESWFLLEREATLIESDKTGWEAPEVWGRLNSMILVACDPAPERVEPGVEGWDELGLTWTRAASVRLRLGLFSELDPADCDFVFRAAEGVARDGRYGCRPYLPVRTSTGFMGSVLGLTAGAWLLEEFGHPEAPVATAAAVEAFGAIIASEQRGYYGAYQWNALRAAYYLRRIAPTAFDYEAWAHVWADREFRRCPPGWKTPPWSDTALRAIQAWRYAWLITGEEKYRAAMEEGMSEFALSEARPIEGFEWRGQLRAFDGYDCTGSAMLLGEWGHRGDPRAEAMVEAAGDRYFCDLGFIPYRTWTCDDLLPYYVGYSLPRVFPGRRGLGEPTVLRSGQFAAYDSSGNVVPMPRPAIPPPP